MAPVRALPLAVTAVAAVASAVSCSGVDLFLMIVCTGSILVGRLPATALLPPGVTNLRRMRKLITKM